MKWQKVVSFNFYILYVYFFKIIYEENVLI